jgi:hypothetical protein
MTSEVDICKYSLSQIRAGSINSLTESSLNAQQCALWYPKSRDQLLTDAPFQFAHRLKALAPTTDEIFNWAYVYQYPSDCLHINHLVLNYAAVEPGNGSVYINPNRYDRYQPNLNAQVPYKIYNIDGNRVIASNHSDLRADYRSKITDPNLFSQLFIDALTHLLASKLSTPLIGGDRGDKEMQKNLTLYRAYLDAAVSNDLNEQYTPAPESPYITVRR